MEIKIGDYFSDFFVEGWNLDINQNLKVEYLNASQFLKPERLDLVCKLFYIDCREKKQNEDLARKLYRAHLCAFSLGSFTEPGSEEKNSLDKYFNAFDELIDDAKEHGLLAEKSVVPVGDNNSILDGSHRTAIAIYYKLLLPIVRIEGISKVYDYEFFQSRGLEECYLDFMAYLFIIFNEHSFVACLWPRADIRSKIVRAEQMIKEKSRIVYRKQIKFNYHGLQQLMIHIYGTQKWAGTIADKFKGIPFKAKECYRNAAFTTVYVLSGGELEDMVVLKAKIREIFQVENHSIHITDTKDEAIEAGKELLFQSSIKLLNYGDITRNVSFVASIIEHHLTRKNSECLTPAAVKILYGLNETVSAICWDSQPYSDIGLNYGYVFGEMFLPFEFDKLTPKEKTRFLLNKLKYGMIADCVTNLNVKAKIRHMIGGILRKLRIIK